MNKKRLSDSRKAQGLSQRELGEKLGFEDEDVAKVTISRYERGIVSPEYKTAHEMAKILDVPLCYFYIEDEKDFFAEQVLNLHRTGNTKLEEELSIARERIQQYEKALKTVLEITQGEILKLEKGA
ncbi:helix-turn-helix domain-containing protein [Xenorhabdus ishibashii]|nr:helix-turn-helix transcriptional regulator [Xenorhabdus ishibashii]